MKIGDRVRSYDFPDSPRRAECYVEGVIVGFRERVDCKRYVILVDKDVWDGKDYRAPGVRNRVGEEVFPPVNGTRRSMGGICDGVELVKEAA